MKEILISKQLFKKKGADTQLTKILLADLMYSCPCTKTWWTVADIVLWWMCLEYSLCALLASFLYTSGLACLVILFSILSSRQSSLSSRTGRPRILAAVSAPRKKRFADSPLFEFPPCKYKSRKEVTEAVTLHHIMTVKDEMK